MLNRLNRIVINIKWVRQHWKHIGTNSRVGSFSVINADCIEIGNDFRAGDNLRLQAWKLYEQQSFSPRITIGDAVTLMENCQFSCCSEIAVDDGCLFGANVFITDNFHGKNTVDEHMIRPIERSLYVKGPVHIGKNVLVGRNVCIMPGVNIGNGVVIGANSVVTHDIPEGYIVAGCPAKVIKHLIAKKMR